MGNADAAIMRLKEILIAGFDAKDAAAMAMGEVAARAVEDQLSKTSHAPRTPTPAPVGGPPAMISRALRDSVEVMPAGWGTVEVGATTRYARIQQMGGWSGAGRATRTPARPYLGAAWEQARLEAVDAAVAYIADAVFGG